jgi:uncharacterized membrane protein
MHIKIVNASRGWRWIVEGMLIFRKNPTQWLLLIALLFIASRVLLAIPLIGAIAAVLIAPNFLAGLAHGAQALTEGKPLRPGYLASGFLKNAAQLIAIGGISLFGQLLTVMAMVLVGGETMNDISKTMTGGAITPATVQAVRTGMPNIMLAMLVGLLLSIPVMMAVWFSPLLVFFDDIKPFPALVLSLWACLKNSLPFLLYGMAVLAPMMILMPLSLAARQPDLGLWLLAPILVPSIYASYRDLFVRAPAQQ